MKHKILQPSFLKYLQTFLLRESHDPHGSTAHFPSQNKVKTNPTKTDGNRRKPTMMAKRWQATARWGERFEASVAEVLRKISDKATQLGAEVRSCGERSREELWCWCFFLGFFSFVRLVLAVSFLWVWAVEGWKEEMNSKWGFWSGFWLVMGPIYDRLVQFDGASLETCHQLPGQGGECRARRGGSPWESVWELCQLIRRGLVWKSSTSGLQMMRSLVFWQKELQRSKEDLAIQSFAS